MMNAFRDFLNSFFQKPPTLHAPPELYVDEDRQDEEACIPFLNRHGNEEREPRNHMFGFGGFPSFSRDFEEIQKEMDETFDELFRIFGVDNMPMFDPYIPTHPHGGTGTESQTRLPANGNVRDRMLRRPGNKFLYGDEEVNVRSRMLKTDPTLAQPSERRTPCEHKDIDWDSMLKEGGSVNDILDGNKRSTQPSADATNKPKSFFRFSSTVTTRRPDGTVETRRITRDGSGNEQETVEIHDGS